MDDYQPYYYILFINDRISGEEVTLFRSMDSALKARNIYVDERLRYDGAPDELEGYPDYIGGGLYEYSGDGYDGISAEDGGNACVYRVKVKD